MTKNSDTQIGKIFDKNALNDLNVEFLIFF